MRIQVLAGLALGALYGLSVAQTAAKPLRADRVVVLKRNRAHVYYSTVKRCRDCPQKNRCT